MLEQVFHPESIPIFLTDLFQVKKDADTFQRIERVVFMPSQIDSTLIPIH